jgi:hypothetical protein
MRNVVIAPTAFRIPGLELRAVNSDSRNSNHIYALARHWGGRSCRVFFVMVLLPATGGMTQKLDAQAAPEAYVYYLTPSRDRDLDRLCAGEEAVFYVIAERKENDSSISRGQDPTPPQPIAGVTINGTVLDPSYGKLSPTTSKTLVGRVFRGLTRAEPPGSAVFFFTALKPGRTELRFTGRMNALLSANRDYVPFTRPVRVVPCKVKVSTSSTWSAGMDIVATIDEAQMDADDAGRFTGSANVTWKTSVIGVGGCTAAETSGPSSKAELTGEIDESDQLVIKITFAPKDFSGFATCWRTTVTENLATPDPLTISVATTGGSATQGHAVTAKNGSFSGSASIVVTPELSDFASRKH